MQFEDGKPLYIRGVVRQLGAQGPIPPSLFEPELKCQWAKMHLESLKAEIERFNHDYPYQILPEVDSQARQYVIRIIHPRILQALDAVRVFGDFLACLRSSLDCLAWQLALLSGDWPGRDTSFPICGRNTVETQVRIAKTTFGIPDDAVTIMKSFQPYRSGDAYKSNHLWRLNMLGNIQKHRHISAFAALPQWQIRIREGYPREWTLPFPGEQIDNCTVMRLPLAAKNYVDFNPELPVDLRFYDEREGVDVGYDDLFDIYEFIAEEVIPAFARFFPRPEIPS
ncbi:MAG: hypothetical protein WAM66_09680 [Acidobacteriaceae bacterium]